MNEQEKQEENKPKRDEHGRLLPGNTANPDGRPKGKTIKERVREWLEEHPNDMESFVQHFVKKNRDLAWQMLEGRPKQDHDVDLGFKPKPLDDVYQDDSIQENQADEEADQSDSGRNGSI